MDLRRSGRAVWRGVAAGAAFLAFGACAAQEDKPLTGKPYHHVDGGFRNPEDSPTRTATTAEFLGFLFNQIVFPKKVTVPDGHVLPPPEALVRFAALDHGDTITWIGHATFLLRIDGVTVLTDPFMTDYASPLASLGLGPKRYVAPGIAIEDLPPIDVIVLSHNHYEHLDLNTLDRLPNRGTIDVVTTLGLGHYFAERGYGAVTELDWYQATETKGVHITALPAVHFSKRGFFDRNKTLWASFAIASQGGTNLYFSGDTAYYAPVFREIGERSGPFDLALVGIGAYEPRSIMVASHATPEEAAAIGRDIGAKAVVGMHWGTISLTPEPPFEAPQRFRDGMAALGYDDADGWVMRIGETRPLPSRQRRNTSEAD